MIKKTPLRKTISISKLMKVISFISIALLIIRLAFIGELSPTALAVLLLIVVCVFAIGKKFLYSVLGIISFVLFVKLKTSDINQEWAVYTSVICLLVVLGVVYKMIKNLFN